MQYVQIVLLLAVVRDTTCFSQVGQSQSVLGPYHMHSKGEVEAGCLIDAEVIGVL